jgi:hypothetical protein
MHQFVHILPIICRIFAAIVGAESLYIAIFMYEDDKKNWVNRIENFWIGVYDRAKKTDSVFTALVNKVSTGTVKVFNSIFGAKPFSLKLIAVSVNLSFAIGTMAAVSIYPTGVAGSAIVSNTFLLVSAAVCLFSGLLAIWSDDGLLQALSLGSLFAINMFEAVVTSNLSPYFTVWDYIVMAYVIPMLTVLVSCTVDALSIVIIRNEFAKLQQASGARVLSGIAVLFLIAFTTCALPWLLSSQILASVNSPDVDAMWRYYSGLFFGLGVLQLAEYNLVTAVYCLVPGLALVALLLHKRMWPLLAKVTYPLLSFKVIQDKKLLISIGTLALGYAIGGDYLVLKIIEKLGG